MEGAARKVSLKAVPISGLVRVPPEPPATNMDGKSLERPTFLYDYFHSDVLLQKRELSFLLLGPHKSRTIHKGTMNANSS